MSTVNDYSENLPTIRDYNESFDSDELKDIKEGVHTLYNKVREEVEANYEKMKTCKEKVDGTLNKLKGLYEIELKLKIGSGYKQELKSRIDELESYSSDIESSMNILSSVFANDPLVKSTVDKKVLRSLLDTYVEYKNKAELFGSDLEEMENSIKKLEWEQNLYDKVDYLSMQMEELQQQNDDLNIQINNLLQQNDNLNAQLSDLQQQNDNLNAQLNGLQQQNITNSKPVYSSRANNPSRLANSTRSNSSPRSNRVSSPNNSLNQNTSPRTNTSSSHSSSSSSYGRLGGGGPFRPVGPVVQYPTPRIR